jgi:putative ABC transport system permease protein
VVVTNEIRALFDRLGYEILVIPNQLENPAEASTILTGTEGVSKVSPSSLIFIGMPEGFENLFTGDNQLQVFGMEPADGMLEFDYVEGEGWSNDTTRRGVVISTSVAKQLGIQAGDTVEIVVAGQPHTIDVIGVDSSVWDAVNMRWDEISEMAGLVFEGQPVPNAYYVTLENPDQNAEEVDEAMELVQANMIGNGMPGRFINQVQNADVTVQQAQAALSIFLVTAVLIAVVGIIGLLTTLTISVYERQKEIGVMRSIGAGSGVIAFQFFTEGILVGIIAWLVGLPLSYYVALGLMQSANLDNVKFTYPPSVAVIGLVGMLFIAGIASFGPSLAAARKTVSDILRYQ